VRFSRPVRPGQKITTRVWPTADCDGRRVFAYETYNPEGQAVMKDGIAEVDA
jgi:acyl dehydratase